MTDQPPEDTTAASDSRQSKSVKSESTRRVTTELVWLLLLVIAISTTTSVIGVLLSARASHPAPPVKVGVVDVRRLTRALAASQPEGPASLTQFDEATKRLLDAEPGLILLVKEAVVGADRIDDYTDALISSLLGSQPSPDRLRN